MSQILPDKFATKCTTASHRCGVCQRQVNTFKNITLAKLFPHSHPILFSVKYSRTSQFGEHSAQLVWISIKGVDFVAYRKCSDHPSPFSQRSWGYRSFLQIDRVPIHNIVAVADVLPRRNNSPPLPAAAGEALLLFRLNIPPVHYHTDA